MVNEHEQKLTLEVDVIIPEHEDRASTSLFKRTKGHLMDTPATPLSLKREEAGRCFICGLTEDELDAPLEAHHFFIERCYAEGDINWAFVKEDFPNFDWGSFKSPYDFVDDMDAQGILLCKEHHTGKGTGIHNIPFGFWIMQRYLKDGAKFSPTEIIEHSEDDK